MSRYLSALKKAEIDAVATLKNLNNLALPCSLGSLGTPPAAFEINHASNDDGQNTVHGVSFVWLIHLTDREPLTATFSPAVRHAAVLACYPDAVSADHAQQPPKRSATNAEVLELQYLVTTIYRGDLAIDQEEALNAALADSDAALLCYRNMAAERGLALADDDWGTCRNLRGQICIIAKPDSVVSAVNGYRPGEMFKEQFRRCNGCQPRAG
jgi:hypothetical protein